MKELIKWARTFRKNLGNLKNIFYREMLINQLFKLELKN